MCHDEKTRNSLGISSPMADTRTGKADAFQRITIEMLGKFALLSVNY